MTISELKAILNSYPDDFKVILNNSRDYEDFDEAKEVSIGIFNYGFCGGHFEYAKKSNPNVNSIILS